MQRMVRDLEASGLKIYLLADIPVPLSAKGLSVNSNSTDPSPFISSEKAMCLSCGHIFGLRLGRDVEGKAGREDRARSFGQLRAMRSLSVSVPTIPLGPAAGLSVSLPFSLLTFP